MAHRLLTSLELKIPPPAVAAGLAGAMWLAARSVPISTTLDPRTLSVLAAGFIGLGLAVDLAGIVSFLRARTTLNPLRPERSTAIVASGVYALTRNPMYLGLVLILTGWACRLGSPLALAGPPLFAAYIQRFQIGPEERALTERFGTAYLEYCARVRRWI